MNTLILKLGATGDVVRTTPLLRRLDGHVSWITAAKNLSLLSGLDEELRCISWEDRQVVADRSYDLVINLEDEAETSLFLEKINSDRTYGAYLGSEGGLAYSADSRGWFDLSMISRHGRSAADRLKLENRLAYQTLLFKGLGLRFEGEKYLLPSAKPSALSGDVAISAVAGAVWPMKSWAYYDELRKELETQGLRVNFLPTRASLLEHLADVQAHRCLVSGDSLPMHLALGSGVNCVTIFNCTSPWEIHDYGIQEKIVSPRLEEFFYKRDWNEAATTAVSLAEVLDATLRQLALTDGNTPVTTSVGL